MEILNNKSQDFVEFFNISFIFGPRGLILPANGKPSSALVDPAFLYKFHSSEQKSHEFPCQEFPHRMNQTYIVNIKTKYCKSRF